VQAATAYAHFFAGRYEEAASWAGMAVDARTASYVAAAANALVGHLEEARQAVARLQQRDPTLRISTLRDALGPYRPEDLAKYEAGLRQAGLPKLRSSHRDWRVRRQQGRVWRRTRIRRRNARAPSRPA
jgi:hypothetical protein